MRRSVVVILLVTGALVFSTAAVAAGEHANESVNGAEADWTWLDGDSSTEVHIRVADDRLQSPGAPNERSAGVNVQVFRVQVDPATGSTVTEFLSSDPYYAPTTTVSMHLFTDAAVTADVSLAGMRWSDAGEETVGPFLVSIAAVWTANGAVTRSKTSTWSTEFGGWLRQRVALSSAPARAEASITGDLDLGALGPTDGQFVVLRDSSLTLESGAVSALAPMTMLDAATSTSWSSHVLRAAAGWSVDDGKGTQVLLSIEQAFDHSDRAAQAVALVEIDQSYCDRATDESVMRMLFGGPTPVTSGSVAQSMAGATVEVTFAMIGIEIRSPGCEEARDGESEWTDVGPYAATVAASWVATGDLEFYRVRSSARTGGSWERGTQQARGRQASASGEITGDLGSASLTEVINAYLEDSHEAGATSGDSAS